MEFTFLGTSSAAPTKTRATSCLALRPSQAIPKIWLFDCGEGAQRQIQHCPTVSPAKIDRIFITHMHGDHCFGLPGLLCTIGGALNAVSSQTPGDAECCAEVDRSLMPCLHLYGPRGLRDFLNYSLSLTYSLAPPPFKVHELLFLSELDDGNISMHEDDIVQSSADGSWLVFDDADFTIHAAALEHTVPCVAYIINEKPKPGSLLVDKLKQLGVPSGPIYSQLKSGRDVSLPDGRLIRALDVVGPPKKTRKICIFGDTSRPSETALALATDCDILVHEATYFDDEVLANAGDKQSKMELQAIARGHSTAKMAAIVARNVQSKCLVLNHFSSRYPDFETEETRANNEISLDDFQRQALQYFSGEVVIARDFMRYERKSSPRKTKMT